MLHEVVQRLLQARTVPPSCSREASAISGKTQRILHEEGIEASINLVSTIVGLLEACTRLAKPSSTPYNRGHDHGGEWRVMRLWKIDHGQTSALEETNFVDENILETQLEEWIEPSAGLRDERLLPLEAQERP